MSRINRAPVAFLLLILISTLFFPASTEAGDPRCADTRISAPVTQSNQSGVMLITGRAQLEGAFVRYQVDFSTAGLNLWVLINSAPQAVMDGTLARWDTTLVPEGSYDLRVRTIDTTGNYCENVVSSVNIRRTTADGGGTTAGNVAYLP